MYFLIRFIQPLEIKPLTDYLCVFQVNVVGRGDDNLAWDKPTKHCKCLELRRL